MAYDEELAFRIRALLETLEGVFTTKRMFGGMAFLLDGHIVVAASSQGNLMVRVDPERHDEFLAREHVIPMVMGGRETQGWIRVEDAGYESDAALADWVGTALTHVRSLPKQ